MVGGGGDDFTLGPAPGGEDRTVIRRPTPGRRTAPEPPAGPRPEPPAGFEPPRLPPAPSAPGPAAPPGAEGPGLNPLVESAATLLSLSAQLRVAPSHPDVSGLHQRLRAEVQEFEARARALGVRPELVLAARYALCTVLDDAVLSTPWGSDSRWSKESLLSLFHNEVWGGEKFFQILDRMLQEPARNLDLLELLYVCIALGFQGRYQVLDGGRAALDRVQENLYATIRGQRGEFERELSPRWHGIQDRRNPLVRYVPLWVVGALAGALLLALYVGFLFTLNSASDPVFAKLGGIGRETPPKVVQTVVEVAQPPAPEPAVRKTLRTLLEPEVREGLVELRESAGETTIVIRGDGLFASGSATVRPEYAPLIARIGQALADVQGRVLVSGHTDSVAIRTVRFPSNWHLSQARADAVVSLLAAEIGSAIRLSGEGRADAEPVAANDTAANRARNRRVEITLIWG